MQTRYKVDKFRTDLNAGSTNDLVDILYVYERAERALAELGIKEYSLVLKDIRLDIERIEGMLIARNESSQKN